MVHSLMGFISDRLWQGLLVLELRKPNDTESDVILRALKFYKQSAVV